MEEVKFNLHLGYLKIMDKILVTGNLGFIGQHLCRKLVSLGYKFKGVDIKNGGDIRKLTPDDFEGIDYVFHLAAQARVQQSVDDPINTNSHNIDGTLNVLWCAKEAGVKRVIYSASSSAYGDQDKLPLTEDMKPNPMSPYATQKLVGEMYCKNFADLYDIETVSLRYFNVYGENMPKMGAYTVCLKIFLDCKEEDKPLPLHYGEQTRDFTYVGDVVWANILAMHSEKVGKGEVINIGTGKALSIREMAEAISDDIEQQPRRKGEPLHVCADNSKAKKLLDWKPKVHLLEWLKNLN